MDISLFLLAIGSLASAAAVAVTVSLWFVDGHRRRAAAVAEQRAQLVDRVIDFAERLTRQAKWHPFSTGLSTPQLELAMLVPRFYAVLSPRERWVAKWLEHRVTLMTELHSPRKLINHAYTTVSRILAWSAGDLTLDWFARDLQLAGRTAPSARARWRRLFPGQIRFIAGLLIAWAIAIFTAVASARALRSLSAVTNRILG
ncbi:hypothetical protein [Schumannella sp. 10F1B-5-1]|uniref:hypothetical protein n=1 Tax=Schumannella sp. 10F1B-5-1 TaxID=2590780 RepID=UPI001131DB99|nr:hypothetical protein [Schumannella sp. 10F1B-5-1]TPW73602.1 hypothetical protein FJ658_05315 [Schumannella sp. 10F1B-5-1]